MKKMLICCATLCVTLTLFCVAALATDLQVKVEPVNAETVTVAEKQGGADRVFTVTKDSGVKAGDLYLVLIQKGSATDKPKPTAETIYYIDVKQADDSKLSIDATPRDMEEGSYAVYLSDWSDSGKGAAKGVATITLSAPTSDPGDSTTPGGSSGGGGSSGSGTTPGGDPSGIMKGDLDNDQKRTVDDVMMLIKAVVNNDNSTNLLGIADFDNDNKLTVDDVMVLIRMVVNNEK